MGNERIEASWRSYLDTLPAESQQHAAEGFGDSPQFADELGALAFFSRTLPDIGRKPSPDMPLVCERFRVVYS